MKIPTFFLLNHNSKNVIKYGQALDQIDNVYNDMILKKITS